MYKRSLDWYLSLVSVPKLDGMALSSGRKLCLFEITFYFLSIVLCIKVAMKHLPKVGGANKEGSNSLGGRTTSSRSASGRCFGTTSGTLWVDHAPAWLQPSIAAHVRYTTVVSKILSTVAVSYSR